MSNEPKPERPDLLVGRKLPEHALWEVLQRRAQPLALEFCSSFFNNEMSYKKAQKWLEEYGIKTSVNALQGFYNSLDMRMRFASLQAAASAETAKSVLPADIEAATKERIAQLMFELSFTNLGEAQKLQLVQIQQNAEGMKGNFALKKAKLDLDREKLNRVVIKHYMDWFADQKSREILESSVSNTEKFEQLGLHHFGRLWNLQPTKPAAK
jgi:hypothetical protein